MAILKHLMILKQGVKVWNEWRWKKSDELPNLSDTDLSGVDFRKADLSEANLSKADLRNANLRGAYLRDAYLSEADLTRVKNLTIEQLSKIKTLYKAKLDPGFEKETKEKYPHLFEEPEWMKEEEETEK